MSDALAELFADLGIKIDERSWNRAEARLMRLEAQARQQAERASNSAGRAVNALLREQERAGAREARGRAVMAARQETAAQRATDRELVRRARVSSAIEQRQKMHAAHAQAAARHQGQEAQKQSAAVTGMIGGITAAVAGLALSLGSQLASSAGEALISFNANLEDSKNQIAGMLALTKNTHLAQELGNADMLVANLQKRAATLPGTTAEYVSMLANITRPIIDAKMGMQDLEDITVQSVIAAKAFGIDAGVAARDIDQALRGIYHSVDPFSGKVLGSIGYKGEEGRSRYNALSEQKRASEFKRALAQPQIEELGAAQGKSFRGLLSTIQDTFAITAGRIGKPLFGEMSKTFGELIAWINKNQDAIDKFADKVGGALVDGFRVVKGLAVDLYDVYAKHPEAIRRGLDLLKSQLVPVFRLLYGLAQSLIGQLDAFFTFMETDTGQAIVDILKMSSVVGDLLALFDSLGISIKTVFDIIMTSNAISALIFLVTKLENLSDRFGGGRDDTGSQTSWLDGQSEAVARMLTDKYSTSTPTATPVRGSGSGGVTIGQVSVGDIHVTTPSTDPGAVAKEARKVFGEELKGHLRKTMDEVS
jgi:hypothetical protein